MTDPQAPTGSDRPTIHSPGDAPAASEFHRRLSESARLFAIAADNVGLLATLENVATAVVRSLEAGGTLFTCGNGGSAAQATHLAAELVGPFENRRRPAYRAIPLGFDPSSLTAISNDYDYTTALARQLRGLARPGDVLWGLSTSGNSPNVVAALEAAREIGVETVLFTNHDGGAGAAIADHVLATPQSATAHVQELHIAYGHALCGRIEAALVASGHRETTETAPHRLRAA